MATQRKIKRERERERERWRTRREQTEKPTEAGRLFETDGDESRPGWADALF